MFLRWRLKTKSVTCFTPITHANNLKMSNLHRSDFHSRTNPFDDESETIPAWIYAFAIGIIVLVLIVR